MTAPVAVVPVRSFRSGKSRLAHLLPEPQRQSVAEALAARVVGAARAAGLLPLVVTADSEVEHWATDLGLRVVADPDTGLDAASRAGAQWAEALDARWVVLHSDLPLISASDMMVIAALMQNGRDPIAPSSDGGTSALSSAAPIHFRYGPGSFHRHLVQLSDPVVVTRRGLLHDLDTPDDLTSAIRAGAVPT
jgi:2-phospho-L-lactate/phosphoenolpyruvate guanylyltransferase